MVKSLKEYPIKDKTVILRVDYNVSIIDDIIVSTKKIDSSFETIDNLVENGNKVIILSHFGRVKNESDKEKNSLYPVYQYIKSINKYNISFCDEFMGAKLDKAVSQLSPGEILLVENTRFADINGKLESGCDVQLSLYWAGLADYFVLDAFGSMHREHASVTGIAKYLPSRIGFLVEKEIKNLDKIINNPKHPFIVIMGGAKLDDKIELIYSLIEKADYILLGGGIANTFLKAAGYKIGASLSSSNSIEKAQMIISEYKDKIVLPKDVICTPSYNTEVTLKSLNEIEVDDVIGDIGPKAIENYKRIILTSKTIFVNGTVGVYEKKYFSNGTQEIFEAVSQAKALKIVGGGDAASAAEKFGYVDKLDFISTGGGATLEYIGSETLPGIEAIRKSNETFFE